LVLLASCLANAAHNTRCRPNQEALLQTLRLQMLPENNQVLALSRDSDGKLTQTGNYYTGSAGQAVDFDIQGDLQLSDDHRFLYAADPADDQSPCSPSTGLEARKRGRWARIP
jgi:hypothetical protein